MFPNKGNVKKKGFPIKTLAKKKSKQHMATSSCKGRYKLHQENSNDGYGGQN